MQRILDPGKIEDFAQRAVPRLRPPDRAHLFVKRAARLRQLSAGHSLADYLRLMAELAEAQHTALSRCGATLPTDEHLARMHNRGIPPIQATTWLREAHWRDVLAQICEVLMAQPRTTATVRDVCQRLRLAQPAQLESQADLLLSACGTGVAQGPIDVAAAPFVTAALQVYWVALASRLPPTRSVERGACRLCPLCGMRPVASIVRADRESQGYRYLHCALCAMEWHMVRITCSQCEATRGISYQSIDGQGDTVRAECCDSCHTYRKILYQEKDPDTDPVADDLASLALDLLLSDAGYHRANAQPLLWQ